MSPVEQAQAEVKARAQAFSLGAFARAAGEDRQGNPYDGPGNVKAYGRAKAQRLQQAWAEGWDWQDRHEASAEPSAPTIEDRF